MFEKEAEKWTIDYVCKDCSRYKECKEHCTCKECSKEKWQNGAEYGYKYKENEWHYIKNGDFPKNTKTVLALCIVGGEPYPYLAQYWKGSTTAKKNGVDLNWNCWLNNMQREVVEPYAWREITIPEFGLQGDCNK